MKKDDGELLDALHDIMDIPEKKEPPEPSLIMELKQRKENMKTISFQIRPSEYEKLQEYFIEELGLKTGEGMRYALKEFQKTHGI